MIYHKGDVISEKPSGSKKGELATVTKSDEHGMFWIRVRRQWLLVMSSFSDSPRSRWYIVMDAKERW